MKSYFLEYACPTGTAATYSTPAPSQRNPDFKPTIHRWLGMQLKRLVWYTMVYVWHGICMAWYGLAGVWWCADGSQGGGGCTPQLQPAAFENTVTSSESRSSLAFFETIILNISNFLFWFLCEWLKSAVGDKKKLSRYVFGTLISHSPTQ